MPTIPPLPVPTPGPAYATDLHAIPGFGFSVDYGTDDTIYHLENTTDMTVTVHGGNDTVTTGYGDDTIFDDPGLPLNQWASKSSGDDVISASSGNDTIFAGDGHNTYDGGGDIDTINYSRATVGVTVNLETGVGQGNGTDRLFSFENVTGSDYDDNITGSNFDHITGLSIDNVLKGGKGNDVLTGGDGHDTLFGGADNDVLIGGKGPDTMYGEDGNDTLSYVGSSAGVTVDLSRGVGHGGDAEGDAFKYVENVTGSQFNDTLIGDNGDNVLNGGRGVDTLIGGGGKDTFVFSGLSHIDSTVAHPSVIKDFVQGEDLIDLRDLGPSTGGWGSPVQHQHQLVDQFSGAANEVMVVVGTGSTTILADLNGDKFADFAVQLSDPVHLTANDFLL
jgi:Ca2+-binding RTX toxin-like protein